MEISKFMVCGNCMLGTKDEDEVICGKELLFNNFSERYEFPVIVEWATSRCRDGLWVVSVNGKREIVPISALVLDESLPAFEVHMPQPEPEQPKPMNEIDPELREKIKAFVNKKAEGSA